MIGPDFPDEITVTEPDQVGIDPDTGNPVSTPSAPRTIQGNLQRRPYFTPEGQFVRNDWVVLLPPGDPITDKAKVAGRGHKFEVDDLPAERRDGINGWQGVYIAVPLRYIGDMQGENNA